ncbi:hypothetical protein N665_0050s0008 [Sinapis alba]|nr:hypothetical protein N665_0050s0008 [Sinapis alba]
MDIFSLFAKQVLGLLALFALAPRLLDLQLRPHESTPDFLIVHNRPSSIA